MFCNMIAWKEGNDYVFEDGSKAYTFPDNEKRFDTFMLIPDWIVRGLEDTPFRFFGFKNGKIHIVNLGVFTRQEFEEELPKYKFGELQKFIGKTIRLENGEEVTLKEYKNFKFFTDRGTTRAPEWLHVKDVITGRNVLYSFGTDLVAHTGEPYERVEESFKSIRNRGQYSVRIGKEVLLLKSGTLGYTSGMAKTIKDILPIISEYMYRDRVLYYSDGRMCKIVEVVNAIASTHSASFKVEFLNNKEVIVCKSRSLFRYGNGRTVKGMWVDAKVIDSYYNSEDKAVYNVVEFCDGSTTLLRDFYVYKGRLCHSDVILACRGIPGLRILSYRYENGNWYVSSDLGELERKEFVKKADDYRRFLKSAIGKTFKTVDGHTYIVESLDKVNDKCSKFLIRFDNGAVRYYRPIEVYRGEVRCLNKNFTNKHKCGYILDKYKNWLDSEIGLKYKVVGRFNNKLYNVELSNGDNCTASLVRLKTGKILPSFMESIKGGGYIGKYKSSGILSIYFDFKEDLYFLLTADRNILYVSRDGELKKIINHDEE